MAVSKIPAEISRKPAEYIGGVNANDFTTTGFYQVGITTNSPYGNSTFYGILLVFAGSNGHCQQLALHATGTYARGRNTSNDSFSAWRAL